MSFTSVMALFILALEYNTKYNQKVSFKVTLKSWITCSIVTFFFPRLKNFMVKIFPLQNKKHSDSIYLIRGEKKTPWGSDFLLAQTQGCMAPPSLEDKTFVLKEVTVWVMGDK